MKSNRLKLTKGLGRSPRARRKSGSSHLQLPEAYSITLISLSPLWLSLFLDISKLLVESSSSRAGGGGGGKKGKKLLWNIIYVHNQDTQFFLLLLVSFFCSLPICPRTHRLRGWFEKFLRASNKLNFALKKWIKLEKKLRPTERTNKESHQWSALKWFVTLGTVKSTASTHA